MECYILTLDNIHCQSCQQSIIRVLAPLVPTPTENYVLVDIPEKTVTIAVPQRNEDIKEKIVCTLYDAGFDVLLVDSHVFELPSAHNGFWDLLWGRHKRQKKHKEHCALCKKNKRHKKSSSSSGDDSSSDTTLQGVKIMDPDTPTPMYRATFSIGGMTCAACQNSITAAVNDTLPDVTEFAVDLFTKSAIAVVSDKRLVNAIQQAVSDVGYDCEVVEVIPIGRGSTDLEPKKFKVTASLGGMTCASCVNAIKAQVQILPFVQEANITILDNSGEFIITDPKINLPKLQEAVEDAGYEFSLVSVTPTLSIKSKSRTVNLSVTGMFCK